MFEAFDYAFEEFFGLIGYDPIIKEIVLFHSNFRIRLCYLCTLILLFLLFLLYLRDNTIKDLLIVVRERVSIKGVRG